MTKSNWKNLLPDETEEISEENLVSFFSSMIERQNIWHKRFILGEKPPWSEDEFLRDYKFTNVYRELDRNSQWELKNIIMSDYYSLEDKPFLILFFRLINNPEFFEFYLEKFYDGKFPSLEDFSWIRLKIAFKAFRKKNKNPFTSAYLVNSASCPGKSRDWCFANKILPSVFEAKDDLNTVLKESKTAKEVFNFLNKFPGVGNFIAHEFYISLTYFSKYSQPVMQWDENDFTNVGPGAAFGIRLLFPSIKGNRQQKECIYHLRDVSPSFLNGKFKFLTWDGENYGVSNEGKISLHQIEMWLCEYSKYWKMVKGVGKQRSRYKWENS